MEKWLGYDWTYRAMDGETPVWPQDRRDWSNGAFWMRNGSEWMDSRWPSRNNGDVCSLSAILETGDVDRRYFLSAKAAAGILRRAERRGKELPPALRAALIRAVQAGTQGAGGKTT